ncbi:MAG: monoterpene epsilon-lactone hydrolase [Dinoroseobacter sp.]|jgi:monoterpene epsilon-lactone hydrolase
MAILDVLRLSLFTLLSMFHSPGRLIQRRWMTEFVCRLLKRILRESKGKPIDWLRHRTGVMKIRSSAEKNVTFETVTLAGVACQWCRPKVVSEPRHILVYFHGGGYVIGSVAGYQNTLAQLAESSDAHVLAVDYRLGPEHLYPAAQQDCLAVTRQVLKSFPNTPVLLSGDSAGGALAVATSLALANSSGNRKPDALVLLSPWVHPGCSTGSITTHAENDVLDEALLQGWITLYLKGDRPRKSQGYNVSSLADLVFTDVDLATLPPTYVQVAGAEIFFDQIIAFVERAKAVGVSVSLDVFEAQFHVFQTLSPLVPDAKRALVMIGHYIKSVPVQGSKP